jgi:hypothetical protein
VRCGRGENGDAAHEKILYSHKELTSIKLTTDEAQRSIAIGKQTAIQLEYKPRILWAQEYPEPLSSKSEGSMGIMTDKEI